LLFSSQQTVQKALWEEMRFIAHATLFAVGVARKAGL
jgi:hypothetical protein